MLIQPDRMIRKAGRRCARLHRMRILVGEDEVDLAHTLHTGLTAQGYSVDLAHDGRQASIYLARLAEAHLSLGDIDAAVATAHDAVARM
jgi:CheY-like chemotaxis protein